MKNYTRSEDEQRTLDMLNATGEAARFDKGKERYDLISMPALKQLGRHYYNFCIDPSEWGMGGLYNAALYHTREFWDGVELFETYSNIIWAARFFFEIMETEGQLEDPCMDELENFKPDKYHTGYEKIPVIPLGELAKVYTYGTIKYNDNNWRLGMEWGKCYAPLERHASKWRKGEIFDDESGLHHLAHCAWQCFALYEYTIFHKDKDNRYKYQQ